MTLKRLVHLSRVIVLLFLFALASGWAHATVWYVTTTGSDSNPCTLASPCATPDHAFNTVATPGDTVNVAAGVYSYGAVEVHFNTAGTSGNPITLLCVTRGACKITNTVTGNSTVVQITSNFVTMDGFEVTNTGAGNNLGIYILGHDVIARHNIVHDIQTDCGSNGGGGIVPSSNAINNVIVDANLIYNISWVSGAPKCDSTVVQTDGLIAENGTSTGGTVTFSNNIVYNVSGGWGISTDKGIVPTIVNNTVFNTVNGCVVINNAPSGSVVQNNICVYTGLHASDSLFYGGVCAIQNGTASPTTYGHNDLFGNHGGNYGTGFGCSGSGLNTGDIAVDPASNTTFVNWQQNGSGDYHEKAGSPTVGVGNGTSAPNHDYDGTARPSKVGYDMGAYELPNTWFVRADGGTRFSANVLAGQCDGLADVAYPGSGTNQHCAFREYRYTWDDDSGVCPLGCVGQWVISGGDTIVVRGCTGNSTQVNVANPTCRIGWDNGNGGGPTNLWSQFQGNNIAFNPPIPAGTAGTHTRILGGCAFGTYNCTPITHYPFGTTNETQLFGGFGLTWTLNLDSTQYVDLEGIELTTHNGVCTVAGSPAFPRGCSTSPPVDDYAQNGILTNNTTANITFQDVYVHGFNSSGIWGPIGGVFTLNRVFTGFNATSGWNFDDGSDTPDASGSQILATNVTAMGNGCYEEYPIVHSGFPAQACYDSVSNGFGDGWSGQDGVLDVLHCDHCDLLYNTKDGFIGPHVQIADLVIKDSYGYGNMGTTWKWGATTNSTVLFQNNLTVGNCVRMQETPPGAAHNFAGIFITNIVVTGGNLATFTTSTQAFTAGQQVFFWSFNNSGAWVNGQTLTVLSSGLTSNQFQATVSQASGTYTDNGATSVKTSGAYLTNFCRAGGAQFATITRIGSVNNYYGNSIISASNITFQQNCGFYTIGNVFHQETNCGAVPQIYKDNNFLGFNDPAIGDFPALYFAETPSIIFTGSWNNEFGIKSGTGDTCGTNNITCGSPLMVSQPASPWPGSETALDVFNPSTGSGNSFYPSVSSPLLGAGTPIAGLTTDFYGIARPSPPSLGGAELSGAPPAVATPTASPIAGTYTSTQSVTLSTATGGATICYTTNGTTPAATTPGTCDVGSITYSGTITVAVTTTIKALGTLSGDANSSVATFAYTIAPIVATPTASPVAGTYSSTQSVTLSTITGGATICYTIDGSTPAAVTAGTCSHGTTYSGSITVATSLTMKAIGTLVGDTNSSVASFTYTIANFKVGGKAIFSGKVTMQ